MVLVLQQQKTPGFLIADQSPRVGASIPAETTPALKESGSMAAVRFPDKHKRRSAIAAPKDGGVHGSMGRKNADGIPMKNK